MMVWAFIMLAVLMAFVGCIIYLVKGIGRLGIFVKIKEKNAKKAKILCFVTLAAIFLSATIIFSFFNAVIVLLHLWLFLMLSDLVGFIVRKKLLKKEEEKKVRNAEGISAFIITIIYLAIGYYLCNNVWVTNLEIKLDKPIEPLHIVMFADSHMGTTFDGKEFGKYIDEINEQKPDIVFICGDFVDDGTKKEELDDACVELKRLQTKYGVYYCFGNHDGRYYNAKGKDWNEEYLVKALESADVNVLSDEAVLINDNFYVIGRLDYSKAKGRKTMKELIKGLDSSKPFIVLDHEPADYEGEKDAEVDLVLSGHTHGGQLIPINYVGKILGINDNTYGYEKRNKTQFFVTSGISCWEIQFKTGCKSEYVVIDVK